jgi:hypothetical protein
MLDPSIVAASIHVQDAPLHGETTWPDLMTASSHGGLPTLTILGLSFFQA